MLSRVRPYLQPQSSSASPDSGLHREGAELAVLYFLRWNLRSPTQRRTGHIRSVSTETRTATGAATIPTNLRCSEVTGAQVGRDALRHGHGRPGGTPLLRYVCGPVGTGSDLTVCTRTHLFAKRRRHRSAQRSFLEGKETFQ